jgi:hypothetical protein
MGSNRIWTQRLHFGCVAATFDHGTDDGSRVFVVRRRDMVIAVEAKMVRSMIGASLLTCILASAWVVVPASASPFGVAPSLVPAPISAGPSVVFVHHAPWHTGGRGKHKGWSKPNPGKHKGWFKGVRGKGKAKGQQRWR